MTVSKLGFPGIREFLMWISRYGSPLDKKISESKMFKVYEIVSIPSGASYELLVDNTQNPTGDVLIFKKLIEVEAKEKEYMMSKMEKKGFGL